MSKAFGAVRALRDVSLTVAEGETVAVLGPSGCGKSTLLAVVAGLETPDAGDVRWQGTSLAALPVHERRFGLMFQDYALFPHKDVFGNVAFGLAMQRRPPAEIAAAVSEALRLVDLAGYERRDVNVLSGGEQQRVALARSLAPRPRLLMLDEPLGALDRALRETLLDDLRRLLRGQTTLYVTHDQQEAFALAARVAVMNAGQVVQVDAPEALYARPASAFVARFLGLTNLLPARSTGDDWWETSLGRFRVAADGRPGPEALLLIRPDAARPVTDAARNNNAARNTDAARLNADGAEVNQVRGTLTERQFRGASLRATIQTEAGPRLSFEFAPGQLPETGAAVALALDPNRLALLPPERDTP